MNAQRAKEIAASPFMANVLCEGTEVYIQHVDAQNETARIYPLHDRQAEREVPLYTLMEQIQNME
ncbi:H-type small acid-soluble spore protein [Paenibacillus sp. HN-1]|uniref:H-type small acid-soluble spore protein n=1 Tax=Paenibacillus TaxID=44249 RepID=UPI001CA80B1F|nr:MULTISPECIES: H-type small acid-soluble spore protein [Paenibacillus]MBY9080223.1 H-type small acid-soluble spore protein [Paenibacillus sp. CGMCC 1.18879]MBY9083118.1 H-type small acid-soluble spore protein [Paenibacillus sinensis]